MIQLAALVLLTLGGFGTGGMTTAWSTALGGLISIVPNAWFAASVFRHSGARAMEKVVRSAYSGELVKLILMGAGFALVFALVEPLSVPGVFAGFILTHLAGIIALVRLQRAG